MSNTAICKECGQELQIGDYPFCPHGKYKYRPFVPFTDIAISDQPMTFESVRQHEKYMMANKLEVRPTEHLNDINHRRAKQGLAPLEK